MTIRLTLQEQETIIRWDNSSSTASVYTCDPKLMKRLAILESEFLPCQRDFSDEISCEYILPKKWVKIKKPAVYQEETRLKMAERLRQAREKRIAQKAQQTAEAETGAETTV